jgi:hypothetical protein
MTPTQKVVADAIAAIVRQNDQLIKILSELALPSRPGPSECVIDEPANATSAEPIENGPTALVPIVDKQPEQSARPKRKKSDGRGIPVWDSYNSAYEERYQIYPVRNAMTNRICSQLADRLGEDARHVIRFYVKHNDFFYVKNAHAIQYALKDAEKLHMEWSRGRAVTTADARLEERKGHNANVVQQVLENA